MAYIYGRGFFVWTLLLSLNLNWSTPISGSAQLSTENQWKYIKFDNDGTSGSNNNRGYAASYQSPYSVAGELGRPARQLNLAPLTSNSLQSAGVSISDYGNGYGTSDLEFGGYAAAGSHGGGYGGGGGGGYGHGHGKKDCNSALGLLGVLGLMSFLQSVLTQLTSTAAPMPGRRKRALNTDDNFDSIQRNQRTRHGLDQGQGRGVVDIDRVTLHILPYLIRIGQVVDSVAPLNCSLHAICKVNQILVSELEPSQGQVVGRRISNGILTILTQKNGRQSMKKHLAEVAHAAIVGRADGDCMGRYEECRDLEQLTFPGFISTHSMIHSSS